MPKRTKIEVPNSAVAAAAPCSRLADYLESPPPYRKHVTKERLWLVLDAHGDSVLWSDQELAVDAAVAALNAMHKPKCACGEESTGWVEIECCNICGLPHKDETACSLSLGWYLPESWSMLKDSVYAAQEAIRAGIENTQELLTDHDVRLGRTTRSNRYTAERMEGEIRQMQAALDGIQKPNGCSYGESSPMAPAALEPEITRDVMAG